MKNIFLFSLFVICISCNENVTPKPKAYLNLSYKQPTYQKIPDTDIPYYFEISSQSTFTLKENNWANIHYPHLKADINITYQKVNNDIYQLISDAEKLTFKHTLMADQIDVRPFENPKKKVYARIFNVSGNAASPIQFQATDSVKNFISGSLYFKVAPNYDSIQPAIVYVKKDIENLIESLEWTN
ncbi:gliding motility lipoprotein GldD [Wenyingzhuangia sp. IMCC45574]